MKQNGTFAYFVWCAICNLTLFVHKQQKCHPHKLCKQLLSNTTNLLNSTLKEVEDNEQSFNCLKFDDMTILQQQKKDSRKNRRPTTQAQRPKKNKRQRLNR